MIRYSSALHATPVGDVLVTFADDRLLALRVLQDDADRAREDIAALLRTVPDERSSAEDVGTQLDEYFAGTRRDFDVPLDWSLTHGFPRAALQAVCDIPYGETAAYGEVAIRAGSPGAARAVGTACATSPFSIVVPVHRVVRADGSLGRYWRHPEIKAFLLDLERAASDG